MKRLYRSRESKILGGICGGLGEYFDIDPVIVRIIFLVLIFTGVSALFYVVAWVIVPLRPSGEVAETPSKIDREELNKFLPGLVLIVIGAAFLMARIWDWISFGRIWPVIVIVIGVLLIFRALNPQKED